MARRPVTQEMGVLHRDDIRTTFENLKAQNADLKDAINDLRRENHELLEKYRELQQRIAKLGTLLEKSTKVFNELFGITKSTLQMTRLTILTTPLLENDRPNAEKRNVRIRPSTSATPNVVSINPKGIKNGTCTILSIKDISPQHQTVCQPVAGPSGRSAPGGETSRCVTTRQKLHIEPLNVQELRNQISDLENLQRSKSQELNGSDDRLSTILEDNSSSSRELRVTLKRLPSEVIDKHLEKHNSFLKPMTPLTNNSSLNISGNWSLHPDFSSTPRKLEVMRQLDLIPTPTKPSFVSIRKKDSGNSRKMETLVSPKREKKSSIVLRNGVPPPTEIASPKKERMSSKENVVSPRGVKKRTSSPTAVLDFAPQSKKKVKEAIKVSARPSRKAKPITLKEESLRIKKRRN